VIKDAHNGIVAMLVEQVSKRLAAKQNAPTIEGVIRELVNLNMLRVDHRSHRIANPNCVVCGAATKVLADDDTLTTYSMIRDAGTVELSFGYGSRYDCGYVFGVICDDCAKAFIETAAVPMTEASPHFTKHTVCLDEED
jgi:hypothetical protein